MCKSKAEGGKRCAAHTRPKAVAALQVLRDNGANAVTKEQIEDIAMFASTESGREQLVDLAKKYQDAQQYDGAGVIVSAIERGDAYNAGLEAAAASTTTSASADMASAAPTPGTSAGGAVNLMENDGPSLAVTGKYGQRVYVRNPEDREYAEQNTKQALAEGKAFPSITSVLKSLDKPALLRWAVNCSGDEAVRRMEMLRDADPATREQLLNDWLSPDEKGNPFIRGAVIGAKDNQSKTAAARGTHVHALCEEIAHGNTPEIPEELQGYVDAYQSFRKDFPDITVLHTEATVGKFNTPHGGYMGTTDQIVQIGQSTYVLDLKTNKDARIYPETGMQLAAAANADTIHSPDGSTTPMPKVHGALGVALGPNGKYSVRPFRLDDGVHFNGFMSALGAWKWGKADQGSTTSLKSQEALQKFFAA